jgi:hypothetical protein
MKELTRFRQFLAEGEAKGFTFIFKKGEKGKEQIKKAKEILKDKNISFTSKGDMALGFSASQNQKDVKKVLGGSGITQYVIGDIKEDLAEGKFEDETNQYLELLKKVEHNEDAEAMVGDGFFFSEKASPAVNQTQEAIRDGEDEDYMEALKVITDAVKQLGGTVSYIDENGLLVTFKVEENGDLITKSGKEKKKK